MNQAHLMAIALAMAPYTPRPMVAERVEAIIEATDDVEEAVTLLVVDFHETTLGRRGTPFGTSSCRLCVGVYDRARWAVRVIRTSRNQCGRSMRLRLGYYHSGVCRRDRFADNEEAMVRRIFSRWDREDSLWR